MKRERERQNDLWKGERKEGEIEEEEEICLDKGIGRRREKGV